MNRLPLELDRLYGIAAKLAEGSTGVSPVHARTHGLRPGKTQRARATD